MHPPISWLNNVNDTKLHFTDSYLHNLCQVSLVLASSCPQGELQKSSSEQENVWDTQTCMLEGLRKFIHSIV